MFPISQAIVPITSVVLVSPPKPSPPDYQLDNLILMGIYVGLTLVVAIGAILSIFITRASLKASSHQSQAALTASEQQSQAAIKAVNKQIEASETQSKAAIDAVHEQILASEKQAQETLYNQFKPVIVPVQISAKGDHVGILTMQNKGTGVALNAWGVYTIRDNPIIYCFVQAHSLAPNEEVSIAPVTQFLQPQFNAFEREFLIPKDGEYGVVNDLRLSVTYEDAFHNNYLVIFDHSKEFRWKNVVLKRVEQSLDEFIARKRMEAPPQSVQ